MIGALDLFEMDKKDMKKIMSDLGVDMQGEHLRRLIDAFDTNGDAKVSKSEFLKFCIPDGNSSRPAVRGDTAAVLERKCTHETTCCVTGMPNAFVVTASNKKVEGEMNVTIEEKKDGTFRRVVELEERGKRFKILKGLDLMQVDELEELEDEDPPTKCEQAAWDTLELFDEATNKKSGSDSEDDYSDKDDNSTKGEMHNVRVKKQKKALNKLLELSEENRAALTLKEMMDKGKPPPAPQLWAAEVGHAEVGDGLDVLCDRLMLWWRAQPGSLVAFFSIEMSGPLGCKEQQNNEFREIFRDPPDADHETEFSHWVESLQPNTTYSFRIRAFNGFGGGPYARKDFTTQPVAPPTPVLIRASTSTVTIRWKFGTKATQMFNVLKKVFGELGQGSNKVSRNSLIACLEKDHSDVLLYLTAATTSSGVVVYDAIESHDDDNIYMGEIERYQQQMAEDEKGAGAREVDATRTKYVVERCVSHADDVYEMAWRGSAGESMIKALTPNSSARFRVFAVNCDGVRGASSEDICVNTLLDTPGDIKVGKVAATGCKVTWPEVDLKIAEMRKSGGDLDKILSEWTKSGDSGDDNGVSVDMIFSQFENNNNGTIDGSDLLSLLQELGVNPSEDRLRDAWQELDQVGDGSVRFKDFHRWWTSKSVSYVLRRGGGSEGSSAGVVCYRGGRNVVELGGLEPNTK